jgi:hypothetical protein
MYAATRSMQHATRNTQPCSAHHAKRTANTADTICRGECEPKGSSACSGVHRAHGTGCSRLRHVRRAMMCAVIVRRRDCSEDTEWVLHACTYSTWVLCGAAHHPS